MNHRHLDTLTWLRGCAAFFVVVHHCFYTAGVQYGPGDVAAYFTPLNFFDLGTFAVYLFFALSGCALTLGYSDRLNRPLEVAAFYMQRWMRIWPIFAVSLLAYLLYHPFYKYFYTADPHFWVAQGAWEVPRDAIVKYLALTFNITGPKGAFIGAYWSLPVEFQYYLMLPLALWLMRKPGLTYVAPLAISAVLYLIYIKKWHGFDDSSLFSRGYVFFGGVLAGYVYPKTTWRLAWPAALVGFLAIFIGLGIVRHGFVVLPASFIFVNDEGKLDGVVAILTVVLGLFTQTPKQLPRFFLGLKHYGDISYSVYLFHYLFISAAALLVIHFHIYGGYQKFLFVVTFALVGSYFFASSTYRFIEQPCIRLGRTWARRLTARG